MSLLRWCGVDIHNTACCSGTVRFAGDGDIAIGEKTVIRDGVMFRVADGGKIIIGNNVLVGENVILESLSEPYNAASLRIGDNVDFMMGGVVSSNGNARVSIDDNCKIAHNVSVKATYHEIDLNAKCIWGGISRH